MKFGICTNMNAQGKSGTGAEHIAFYASSGFDYVELPLAQVMALDEGDYDALRSQLDASSIPCLACNNFYPAHIRLTGEGFKLSAVVDYSRQALGRAAELGAKCVVFGSSGARNIPYGFDYERAKAQVVTVLKAIAPIAKENGIVIALEQHNPTEGNIFNRFDEVLEASEAAGHASIRCLYDNYHSEVVCEPFSILEKARGKIAHVHISGVLRNREFPADEAHFRELMGALGAIGYDETVSIEANATELYVQAPRSLGMLRRVCG